MKTKVIALALGVLFVACTNNVPEQRNVQPFHYVNIVGGLAKINVLLHQDSTSYRVQIDGHQTNGISTQVVEDTLFVSFRKCSHGKYNIDISAPEYCGIDASLLHSLRTANTLKQDRISAELACIEKLKLDIDAEHADLEIHACDKVIITGQCDTVDISGCSPLMTLDTKGLSNKNMCVSCSGKTLKIKGGEQLWIKNAFLTTIYYDGNPEILLENFKMSSLYYKKLGFIY